MKEKTDKRPIQPIRKESDIRNMRRALAAIDPKYEFLFLFGINTGLRIGDIVGGDESAAARAEKKDGKSRQVSEGLRVRDVLNKSHVTITEQKTGKTKRILINDKMKKIIKAYVKDNNLCNDDFLVPSGKQEGEELRKSVTRIQAYRMLTKAARDCGIPEIGTHTLRKTFGYHYYQKTHDVATLMELFNHSSQKITLRYIGISDDEKDRSLKDFCLGG